MLHQLAYRDRGRRRPSSSARRSRRWSSPTATRARRSSSRTPSTRARTASGSPRRSLALGCDCLGEIRYFDAAVVERRRRAGDDPERDLHPRGGRRRALAAHEWRTRRGRGAPRPPARRSRRSRRSATTTTASSGSCTRTARSSYEVKLTGMLSPAPSRRRAARARRAGRAGPQRDVHQHYFDVRLDLDVDGRDNSVVEVSTESTPARAGEPARQRVRGPAQAAAHRGRGAAARRPGRGALVGDRQPAPRHRLGAPVGYRLMPGENARPFAAARGAR